MVTQAPAFTTAGPAGTGTTSAPYSYAFAASGSPAPVFATLAALPSGWNLDPATGLLSAATPAAGTFIFSVTATNSAGVTAAGPFTVAISQSLTAPNFTADTPPAAGVVAAPYGPYQFTTSGYPAPTFTLGSGSLPTGLLLDPATGVLTGTPLTAGSSSFTVTAHNSVGDVVSPALTIVVAALPVAPLFTAASPPSTGLAGTPYPGYTFLATAIPPASYAVTGGTLPTGLTLNSATGLLTGTPTTAGTFSFTVQAGNLAGSVATSLLTVVIARAPQAPVFTADSPSLTATAELPYPSYSFTASGYPAPTFALAGGSLPIGLVLDPITGALSGTPLVAGVATFTVSAGNATSTVSSPPISILVAPEDVAPPAPATVTLTAGMASLTASWTPVDGATGYRAVASPGAATCSTTGRANTTCLLGAVAGTSYTVTVFAHSPTRESGASTPSNTVTATAPTIPDSVPPALPTTLSTDQGPIDLTQPGQSITVVGDGFAPFSMVTVIIYSTPIDLGSSTTDGTGAFAKTVTVPTLEAGSHTFVASGVDPAGLSRMTALPITVAPASLGGSGGSATLPVPAHGRITLLDAAGLAAVTVTVPQGVYALDQATGKISFAPAGGFIGTADVVHYRITDALGTVVNGSYAAVVAAAPGQPTPAVAGQGGVVARGASGGAGTVPARPGRRGELCGHRHRAGRESLGRGGAGGQRRAGRRGYVAGAGHGAADQPGSGAGRPARGRPDHLRRGAHPGWAGRQPDRAAHGHRAGGSGSPCPGP